MAESSAENDAPETKAQPAEGPRLPAVLRHSLCAHCVDHRIVISGTGSVFLMCQRGLEHSAWPKYPPQPIVNCPHFRPAPNSAAPNSAAPNSAVPASTPDAGQ